MSFEAPETFLELVQRTYDECQIAGTAPTTVLGQAGLKKSLVAWVSTAWGMIQSKHKDWKFMRPSASFETVAGTSLYTLGTGAGTVGVLASAFGRWIPWTFRSYTTAVGTNDEAPLGFQQWEAFRNVFLFGANRNTRTRPTVVTFDPSNSVGLGPVVSAGYTVTGDYYRKRIVLAANADVPACPAEYNMAIVYKAMMTYGAKYSAPNVYQEGEIGYREILAKMEQEQLPPICVGRALA